MKQALIDASQRGGGGNLSKRESHRRDRSNIKKELRQMISEYNGSRDVSTLSNYDRGRGGTIVSQAQALDIVRKMGIPENVLGKPFFRLDNQDIRVLTALVREFYSR